MSKTLIKLWVILAGLLMPAALTASLASAQDKNPSGKLFAVCSQAPESAVCQDKNTTQNPVIRIIRTAANIVAFLTGVAAVIMIMISGFVFVTSGGSPERTTSARRRLIYSVIGLAVVALSWVIITLVLNRL